MLSPPFADKMCNFGQSVSAEVSTDFRWSSDLTVASLKGNLQGIII